MQVCVEKSDVQGVVQAPASKSYTIRALMCAALARGMSTLERPLSADDTRAALSVLGSVGVRVETEGDIWRVYGGELHPPSVDLFCHESAATLRFMTAICAILPGSSRLTAAPSLARRPIRPLLDALAGWGVGVDSQNGTPPLIVHGGNLKGGLTSLPGDISSQFVSALLLTAPLCSSQAEISLTTPLESRSYVLMTLECLRQFGISIEHSENLDHFRSSPQKYIPAHYTVEGDWSSASYLLALAAVAGETTVRGLNPVSLQGDSILLSFLKDMGARVEIGEGQITVKKAALKALHADLNESIDLLPTIAVLAALAKGESELTGLGRARLKESDRVDSIARGLTNAGIDVKELEDSLVIMGGRPRPALLDSYGDHRIAMAFSLLGAAAGGIRIKDAQCVAKTYPEYWSVIRRLGVELYEQ